MPISDQLHELIHSLEPSEKRHFKIFAKRHILNGENQYLRLFEVLEGMPEYDEKVVKRSLGKNNVAAHLSVSKNYLYNLILRSMRSYNSGNSIKIILQELRLDINMLIEKGLQKQARKLIKKAKKIAVQNQYDIDLLEIIQLERKLIRRFISNNVNEVIHGRQQETNNCIDRIEDQFQMLDLYEAIFLDYRNLNEVHNSVEEVIQKAESIAATARLNTSYKTLNYYYLLHFHHAKLSKDHKKANTYLQELITLHEVNPFLIEEDPEPYINHLNNYLNNCFHLKRLEEFPPVLEKMQSVQTRSNKIKGLIFNNLIYLRMIYHLAQEAYQKVIDMVPELEEGLKIYGDNITKSRQLTFFYNIASAFFLQKDYSNALEWIDRILYEPKLEERQDIQSLARIFQLVIHFELEHYDFVDSLITSANRYLTKKDKRNSAEFLIIKHLKEALYADKKTRQLLFTRLSEELKEEKGLEEIKIWVESKMC